MPALPLTDKVFQNSCQNSPHLKLELIKKATLLSNPFFFEQLSLHARTPFKGTVGRDDGLMPA